jgi:integrase
MEVEAIRDRRKIEAMKKKLRAGNLRNEVLFTLGINTALRIGDLLSLTVGDVLTPKGRLVKVIELKEQKTGKVKQFPLNDSVKDALTAYLRQRPKVKCSEPLFLSRKGGPLTRWQARRILSAAGTAVGLSKIGTHSLRKTFGYHVYKKTGGDLGLVQKLLNHSAAESTLRYIGIDREKMDRTYMDLNL